MAWLVVTHLLVAGTTFLIGVRRGGGWIVGARRRKALRWAFESARADAERARTAEKSATAELAESRKRESAAVDQAEDARALAAMLEAEVVAVRWEKEELEARTRSAREALDEKAKGIAVLHAALVAAVRRATVEEDERARLRRAAADGVEVIRLERPGLRAATPGDLEGLDEPLDARDQEPLRAAIA